MHEPVLCRRVGAASSLGPCPGVRALVLPGRVQPSTLLTGSQVAAWGSRRQNQRVLRAADAEGPPCHRRSVACRLAAWPPMSHGLTTCPLPAVHTDQTPCSVSGQRRRLRQEASAPAATLDTKCCEGRKLRGWQPPEVPGRRRNGLCDYSSRLNSGRQSVEGIHVSQESKSFTTLCNSKGACTLFFGLSVTA